MNRVEDAIQTAVIRWVHETYPTLMITTTGNEKFYKGIIACVGITDLILGTPNPDDRELFLELKTKKRKNQKDGGLEDSQIKWNESFDLYYANNRRSRAVAYGYEEAIEIIQKWVEKKT